MSHRRSKKVFWIGYFLVHGDGPNMKRRCGFLGCAILLPCSITSSFLFYRINFFHKVKDVECVERYMDSKWETVLDYLVASEQFDFLLKLIEHYNIPKEKYLYHKGENTIF